MASDHDPFEQTSAVPQPSPGDAHLIISPDTLRDNRIPPGQTRTRKWPVLDAAGTPEVDVRSWELEMAGLVQFPRKWCFEEFDQLPKILVFSDFHCVTRWSRLGNTWQGVAVRELVERCGGLSPAAQFGLASGYDRGWSTNIPVEYLLADDTLVATHHDGVPLTAEHGAPARLIVPRLYAWKSAKWLSAIQFLAEDRAGFWERNGYHMVGDPWAEQRFGW